MPLRSRAQRSGTRLVLPDRYAKWGRQYEDTTTALRAEDRPVDLRNVLAAMRANDAAAG